MFIRNLNEFNHFLFLHYLYWINEKSSLDELACFQKIFQVVRMIIQYLFEIIDNYWRIRISLSHIENLYCSFRNLFFLLMTRVYVKQ